MGKINTGKILKVENVALNVFKLDIFSPDFSAIAGQFVSVLCPNKTLRRPFSISAVDKDTLTILIKLKGEGTNYLSTLKKDDEINFIGPLGNGFQNIKNQKSLLVGAGIGIAPMLFLKRELQKRNIENYLISGFNTEPEVIKGSDETVISGTVLDKLDDLIKKQGFKVIYSCGPSPVLKGVHKIAKNNGIESFLALERVMACGIGVCRGCVIKVHKGNEIKNVSICKDGPIFQGSEIVWE